MGAGNVELGDRNPGMHPESDDAVRALLVQRERQIEAIRRVSETLFTHPGTDAMARETIRIALDMLRADAGTVYLYDPQEDSLVCRYGIGAAGEQLLGRKFATRTGVLGTVFRSAQACLDSELGNDGADIATRFGYPSESRMTVPIRRRDATPIGVMQIRNAQVPPFTVGDLAVLEVLCTQAAIGIEYFQMIETGRRTEIVHVIGDVAHDIKNMLTPITSGVQTLEPLLDTLFARLNALCSTCQEPAAQSVIREIEQIASAVQQDYGWMLQNALFAAEQIQSRTKEIADAVKGETSPPYFEHGSLNETCEIVVQTLKAVAAKHQVILVLDLDPALPLVEFDRKQIYNALYNLVNNALPETPAGGSVTVRTRRKSDAEKVTIEVIDTGRGIPEPIRMRLFTTEAVSTKPGGTGLGTRIVLGVAERHNGTITVESEVGIGSHFTLTIPVRHT